VSKDVAWILNAFVWSEEYTKLQVLRKRWAGTTPTVVVVPFVLGQSRRRVRPEAVIFVPVVEGATGVEVVGEAEIVDVESATGLADLVAEKDAVCAELAFCATADADAAIAEAEAAGSAVFRFDRASAAPIPPATPPIMMRTIRTPIRMKKLRLRSPQTLFLSSKVVTGILSCDGCS